MQFLISLNGDLLNKKVAKKLINDSDLILAADGGLNHISDLDVKPHFFLGDQDSIDKDLLKKISNTDTEIIKFPERKDYTDSELAIRYLLKLYQEDMTLDIQSSKPLLVLLAAFGNRYDHLLSNQFLAKRYSKFFDFLLTDGENFQFVIRNEDDSLRKFILPFENHTLSGLTQPTFSLLAMSDYVENLSVLQADYTLNNVCFEQKESLGISNLPLYDKNNKAQDVTILFGRGCLSIFVSNEK